MGNHAGLTAQIMLANERTFLSWIRTSLALIVTGVALVAFTLPIHIMWRSASATVFVALGIGAAIQGWLGWRATDRAIKAGAELPAPAARVYITGGVIAAVAVLGLGALLT